MDAWWEGLVWITRDDGIKVHFPDGGDPMDIIEGTIDADASHLRRVVCHPCHCLPPIVWEVCDRSDSRVLVGSHAHLVSHAMLRCCAAALSVEARHRCFRTCWHSHPSSVQWACREGGNHCKGVHAQDPEDLDSCGGEVGDAAEAVRGGLSQRAHHPRAGPDLHPLLGLQGAHPFC